MPFGGIPRDGVTHFRDGYDFTSRTNNALRFDLAAHFPGLIPALPR